MSYSLEFVESALKEWRKLAPSICNHLKDELHERLQQPHAPSACLHSLPDFYKIKLRAAGYRLVYRVNDRKLVVIAVAVGKRDKGVVYLLARKRSDKS